MTPHALFVPTREAALARIAAVQPADYARSRNHLDGALTGLSPYITHGIVSLPEVLAGVAQRHPLHVQHRLVFELGWREFFRHVWHQRGDGILQSLHEGPLPDSAYARDMPPDVRQARTGVPVIDEAVRRLYADGHLHNHARLWLASYVVHLRKVHWRIGADWMLPHLIDGDLASNHLSWQWVAGTGSRQPYLFNADNVARYAPAAWHSAGSVIDAPYEALEAIARSPHAVPSQPVGEGVDEPRVSSRPARRPQPQAGDVVGRDVWLVHPWAMGSRPDGVPAGSLVVGWWPAEHHAAWPWSDARWGFVCARMSALAAVQWHGTRAEVARALQAARSVRTVADEHVAPWLPAGVTTHAPPRLFAEVDGPCASFSSWWKRSTRHLAALSDLPGLQAIAARDGVESAVVT